MSEMVYAVHTRTCTYLLDEDGVCGWVLSPTGDQTQDRCIGAQFVACLDLREQGGLVGELRIGAAGLFARREGGRMVLLKTSAIEHVEYRQQSDLSVTAALPIGEDDVSQPPARRRSIATATLRLSPEERPDYGPPPRPASEPDDARWTSSDPESTQPPPFVYRHTSDPGQPPPSPLAYASSPDLSRTQPPPPPPLAYSPNLHEPATGPIPPAYHDESSAPEVFPEPEIIDLEELSTFSSEVTLTIPLYRPDPDDPPPRWGGHEEPPRTWPPTSGKGGRRR